MSNPIPFILSSSPPPIDDNEEDEDDEFGDFRGVDHTFSSGTTYFTFSTTLLFTYFQQICDISFL